MNMMAPTRPAELGACRVRLAAGPAAAAEARSQVRAAISAWHAPVEEDLAILLTSDLVTNAIRHQAGGTVTLAITCAPDRFRVDVHGTSRYLPAQAQDGPETGPGLVLVATLSDEWGFYPTPEGKAVYFALAFQPDPGEGGAHGPEGEP